jgi:hypothetical protein
MPLPKNTSQGTPIFVVWATAKSREESEMARTILVLAR